MREEFGPCQNHIFLVQETTPNTHAQNRFLAGHRGSNVNPDAFAVGSILAKRCVRTHGRLLKVELGQKDEVFLGLRQGTLGSLELCR